MSTTSHTAPWLETVAPSALQGPGPLGSELWQWAGAGAIVVVGGVVGFIAATVVRVVFKRLTTRTESPLDDQLLKRGQTPLTIGLTLACIALLLPVLSLGEGLQRWVERGLQVLGAATVFFFVWRSVEIVAGAVTPREGSYESLF